MGGRAARQAWGSRMWRNAWPGPIPRASPASRWPGGRAAPRRAGFRPVGGGVAGQTQQHAQVFRAELGAAADPEAFRARGSPSRRGSTRAGPAPDLLSHTPGSGARGASAAGSSSVSTKYQAMSWSSRGRRRISCTGRAAGALEEWVAAQAPEAESDAQPQGQQPRWAGPG